MPFSGMWRRVGLVRTDVSEERVPSIFREEKSANEEMPGSLNLYPPPLALASFNYRSPPQESYPPVVIVCSQLLTFFFARGFFYPADERDTFSRKGGQDPYGAKSHKKASFIVTVEETSNSTVK
jgi:hypothetical protein